MASRIKLDTYVVQALTTLFARITKLGWFDLEKDDFVFRNVIVDVGNFLQVLLYHYLYILVLANFLLTWTLNHIQMVLYRRDQLSTAQSGYKS